MGYVLADRRDVGLFVADAANGVRTFTRDPRQARAFPNPEKAREWASAHLLGVELEATVLGSDRDADLATALTALAAEIETAIRRTPHQWFCFRQLWS